MKLKYNFIRVILANYIVVYSVQKKKRKVLKHLGGSFGLINRRECKVRVSSDDKGALAHIFGLLRDEGFYFASGPAGWPPAAVFLMLREQCFVTGSFMEISWKNQNDAVIREL